MCNFFSCIINRDLNVLFCESDSHEQILVRAGLEDYGNIVRAEYTKRDYDNRELLHVEAPEMPIWVERQINVITDLVRAKFKRVYPLRAKYNNIVESAREEYNNIVESAREEYNNIVESAREEYNNIVESAWEEYDKIMESAWEEYIKIEESAWEEYDKIMESAWEEYIAKLKRIPGYVG